MKNTQSKIWASLLKKPGLVWSPLLTSSRADFTSCRIWFRILLTLGHSWWREPFLLTSALTSFSEKENGVLLCYNNHENALTLSLSLSFYQCGCHRSVQSPRSCLQIFESSDHNNRRGQIRRSPPWPPGHLSPPGRRCPRRSWLEIKARNVNIFSFCGVKPDVRTHRSWAGYLPWTEGCPSGSTVRQRWTTVWWS